MISTSSKREGWLPLSNQDRITVLDELEQILASSHFCNSKRYPALLRFVVQNTLDGKSDLLKERMLGVEIFGRPADYDTNSDTIVRYTAGEVRKRLLLYYSEEGRNSPVRIALPAGSYAAEFAMGVGGQEMAKGHAALAEPAPDVAGKPAVGAALESDDVADPLPSVAVAAEATRKDRRWEGLRRLWWVFAVILVPVCAIAAWKWKIKPLQPHNALTEFWAPVLRDQSTVLLCTGGVVFSDNYSGTTTADRNVNYPFVSIQIASSIARISGLLERSGVNVQLVSSSTTPLTELREHSVAFLGGYNNQWTVRLSQPLRFHFSDSPHHPIVDTMHPEFLLERDHSKPYWAADDYALVARYREPMTGGWAVVLAGIGRNGTEAAAQFATHPNDLQLLRDQLPDGFSNRNIEAVLKVNVVDGKTGAPSIVAAYSW
jgi:hypothetical protein